MASTRQGCRGKGAQLKSVLQFKVTHYLRAFFAQAGASSATVRQ
jgi:hypothetical protein